MQKLSQPLILALLIFAAIFLLRLTGIIFTSLEIGPDEAQYWRWSKELDWGYYSKPPLIAWVISLFTSLHGDYEWAIRLPSLLFHSLGAIALFFTARHIKDTITGLYAAAFYYLMPGVWLSSGVMSTDALLLPIMCVATGLMLLLIYPNEKQSNAKLVAVAFGLCIGTGFLAKYAMIYFALGVALALVFEQKVRAALLSFNGLLALITSLIVVAPHIIWNAQNSFATFKHTADNANLGSDLFHPMHGLEFVGDQMAIFGPMVFIGLLAVVFSVVAPKIRGKASPKFQIAAHPEILRILVYFALPPLVIIFSQAIISRAHANWAASAYPAASLLLAFILNESSWKRPFKSSFGFHSLIGLSFLYLTLAPQSHIDAVGLGNSFKRLRGWEQTTLDMQAKAQALGVTAIVTDEREVWHALDYYSYRHKSATPIKAWLRWNNPHNYSEQIGQLDGQGEVLIVSLKEDLHSRIKADFDVIEVFDTYQIETHAGRTRDFTLFIASRYSPQTRTVAFEAYHNGQSHK